MKKGFTLIEILVVLAILTVIGVILTEVFLRSLRGGNKAEVLASLKQNGQSVLELMDKTVRSSGDVLCPVIISPNTKASSDVLVVSHEGNFTRYRLSMGVLMEDHPVLEPGINQEQFLLNICSNVNYPNTIPTELNDKNSVSVSPGGSGFAFGKVFARSKTSGFNDQVTISFRLHPGSSVPSSVASTVGELEFATTVNLR